MEPHPKRHPVVPDSADDPLDRDPDDPELLAWLLQRELDLDEQADARAMLFDEEWRR